MKYRICWKSKITGKRGRGQALFTKDQAEHNARRFNKIEPDIHHWARPGWWPF